VERHRWGGGGGGGGGGGWGGGGGGGGGGVGGGGGGGCLGGVFDLRKKRKTNGLGKEKVQRSSQPVST